MGEYSTLSIVKLKDSNIRCLPFCVRHLPLFDVYGGRQGEEEQGQEGRWREHQDQELGGLCPLLLPANKISFVQNLLDCICPSQDGNCRLLNKEE